MTIENALTRKKQVEIRKSEKILLKALNYLSVNPLPDDRSDLSAEVTSDGENTISIQLASQELDLDEKNIVPNESFIGAQPNLHDMVTGVSDGNFLGEKKTRLTTQPARTSQEPPDTEIHQLAQTFAPPERQKNVNCRPASKMLIALTGTLSAFDGKTKNSELFRTYSTQASICTHISTKRRNLPNSTH